MSANAYNPYQNLHHAYRRAASNWEAHLTRAEAARLREIRDLKANIMDEEKRLKDRCRGRARQRAAERKRQGYEFE